MLFFINTVCVLLSFTASSMAILKHLKNYRKPMDQRLIARILVIVPLFSSSAYFTLYGHWRWFAHLITLVRELYEAFVIYTFYSLLTNLLGGEREIIFSATGRPPARFLRMKLDISDPYTYSIIKRLVIQYVWMRPIVVLATAILGEFKICSIIIIVGYNISVTLALNSLMAFWVCLREDLKPYRVVLKFLSVKMIVFFSYWQSLALSLLHALGFMSSESLRLWGCSLVCWESVLFAITHWYAFPASDYKSTFMFGYARLRIDAAFKDVIGIKDLVHDFKVTFLESHYDHRNFDSVEAVLDHPDSRTRKRRLAAGLRYKNGGRSKYWLPSSSLQKLFDDETQSLQRGPLYGSIQEHSNDSRNNSIVTDISDTGTEDTESVLQNTALNMEDEHSEGEEELYNIARKVYGDYNYPVATVRESEEYVSFQERLRRQRILERV